MCAKRSALQTALILWRKEKFSKAECRPSLSKTLMSDDFILEKDSVYSITDYTLTFEISYNYYKFGSIYLFKNRRILKRFFVEYVIFKTYDTTETANGSDAAASAKNRNVADDIARTRRTYPE